MRSEPSRYRQPRQRVTARYSISICVNLVPSFWRVEQLVCLSCFKYFITVQSDLFLGCPVKYLVSACYVSPILFSCSIFIVLSVINAMVKLSRVFVSHLLAFEAAALITCPSLFMSSCTLLTFFLTPKKKNNLKKIIQARQVLLLKSALNENLHVVKIL